MAAYKLETWSISPYTVLLPVITPVSVYFAEETWKRSGA
jgi:hypothetical protein